MYMQQGRFLRLWQQQRAVIAGNTVKEEAIGGGNTHRRLTGWLAHARSLAGIIKFEQRLQVHTHIHILYSI